MSCLTLACMVDGRLSLEETAVALRDQCIHHVNLKARTDKDNVLEEIDTWYRYTVQMYTSMSVDRRLARAIWPNVATALSGPIFLCLHTPDTHHQTKRKPKDPFFLHSSATAPAPQPLP